METLTPTVSSIENLIKFAVTQIRDKKKPRTAGLFLNSVINVSALPATSQSETDQAQAKQGKGGRLGDAVLSIM